MADVSLPCCTPLGSAQASKELHWQRLDTQMADYGCSEASILQAPRAGDVCTGAQHIMGTLRQQ